MKVKICGLRTEKDVETAIEAGVDALGFLVGQLHTSSDFILPSTARRFVSQLPVFVSPVLVTHLTDPQEIIELIECTAITTVQLHGGTTVEELALLKEYAGNDVKFITAIHIVDREGPSPVPGPYCPHTDAFLLDSLNTAEGRVGGTGRTHDWNMSAQLVKESPRPVILAGGLCPENVQEAIRKVHPYAVDANSRLKAPDGSLDLSRARAFVSLAKSALSPLPEFPENGKQ